jgi:Cft2 family RNA processing exonuclease
VKFINLTRATEIGANSYYIESAGRRLILDSGMHPKRDGDEALPNFAVIGDREIELILISHSHQDHIGTLPVLMRRFPRARVYMTETSGAIGSALLHNSVNVMTRQREELGHTLYPLFTHRETERASDLWNFCRYRQPYTFEGERVGNREDEEFTFEFWDAGHVLGSSGILLRAEGRTVFYTADVNFDAQTISERAAFPETGIDVLIIECTRGDHPTPAGWSRESEEARFAEAIVCAFDRNGCVLIPVFALGKTQELLAMLYKFIRKRILPDVPIYIGGLSAKMTEIYDRFANGTRRQLPRLQLMEDVAPFVLNGETIRDAQARARRIYALSSGMMTEKTLSNVFARRVIEESRHSIFFVGYADPESPGGKLRSATEGDEIQLDRDERTQTVRCNIEQFQFSAHATRESLVEYTRKLAPRKVVLVHGDPPAVEWMRGAIASALPQVEVIIPQPGAEYDL